MLLISKCPDLRPLLLAVVVDGAPVLRIDAVQDDVDVAMLGVVVPHQHCLMSVPSHVLQERIGALDHVLRAWVVVLVPGERQRLDRVFAQASTSFHAGLHLEIALVLGGAPHFFQRALGISIEAVPRIGEPHALFACRFQRPVHTGIRGLVMQVVLAGSKERAA